MSTARFKITGSTSGLSLSSAGGHNGVVGETLTLQLEDSPALDVLSCTYSVQQTSKSAPALTLPSGGVATPPTAGVAFSAPGSGVHTYMLRCTIVTATGVQVFERVLAFRSGTGLRKILPAERTEYDGTGGWAYAQNDEIDAFLLTGSGGDTGPTPNTLALRTGAGDLKAVAFDSGAAADLILKRNGTEILRMTATALMFAAAVSFPTISQANSAGGTGSGFIVQAQKGGTPTGVGGTLFLRGGDGFTPGTHFAGDVDVALGQLVGNQSAKFGISSVTYGTYLAWWQAAFGAVGYLGEFSSVYSDRYWSYVDPATYRFQGDGSDYFIIDGNNGLVESRLGLFQFGNNVTGPFIGQPAVAGTGASSPGTTLTIRAQQGRAVASGTNNNGGNLELRSGPIGTGGANGTLGQLILGLGSSEATVKLIDASTTTRTIELVTGFAFTLQQALSAGSTSTLTINSQGTTSGAGGALTIQAGTGTTTAGATTIKGGNGTTNGNGGNLTLAGGVKAGSGTDGNLLLQCGGTTRLSLINTTNQVQISSCQMQWQRTSATFGATTNFDLSLGNVWQVTLTGNITTLNITNPLSGGWYSLSFIQDGTGSRTLTVPSNLKVAGGTFTLTTTANKRDSLTCWSDGTNLYEMGRAMNV